MKKILIVLSVLSLFVLVSCGKKKACVINLCYINPADIMDNKEGLDVIDEGCIMAKVDCWKNNCVMNKKYKFKIDVFDGYYISRYTITDTYSIENATFYTDIKDNTIEIIPKSFNNYIIVDFGKIE